MNIQTSNGMGIKTSNGMELNRERNYFHFNEYKRKKKYFFGDRGVVKKDKQLNQKSRPDRAPTKSETAKTSKTGKPKPVHDKPEPVKQVKFLDEKHKTVKWNKGDKRLLSKCECFYCRLPLITEWKW